MAGPALVRYSVDEPVVDQLSGKGLSVELIHDCLERGRREASRQSSHELASTPGTLLYHYAVSQFASRLKEDGWHMLVVQNQPWFLRSNKKFGFTLSTARGVASSDFGNMPVTTPKGSVTKMLFDDRSFQKSLFKLPTPSTGDVSKNVLEGAELWFLLMELDGARLNIELARPMEIPSNGKISSWINRIPLPALLPNDDYSMFESPDTGEEEINVIVEPRQS